MFATRLVSTWVPERCHSPRNTVFFAVDIKLFVGHSEGGSDIHGSINEFRRATNRRQL